MSRVPLIIRRGMRVSAWGVICSGLGIRVAMEVATVRGLLIVDFFLSSVSLEEAEEDSIGMGLL